MRFWYQTGESRCDGNRIQTRRVSKLHRETDQRLMAPAIGLGSLSFLALRENDWYTQLWSSSLYSSYNNCIFPLKNGLSPWECTRLAAVWPSCTTIHMCQSWTWKLYNLYLIIKYLYLQYTFPRWNNKRCMLHIYRPMCEGCNNVKRPLDSTVIYYPI